MKVMKLRINPGILSLKKKVEKWKYVFARKLAHLWKHVESVKLPAHSVCVFEWLHPASATFVKKMGRIINV